MDKVKKIRPDRHKHNYEIFYHLFPIAFGRSWWKNRQTQASSPTSLTPCSINFNEVQTGVMEALYAEKNWLPTVKAEEVALQLGLSRNQVQIWMKKKRQSLGEHSGNPSKRLSILNNDQKMILESEYLKDENCDSERSEIIAQNLNMQKSAVIQWFNRKRTNMKKKVKNDDNFMEKLDATHIKQLEFIYSHRPNGITNMEAVQYSLAIKLKPETILQFFSLKLGKSENFQPEVFSEPEVQKQELQERQPESELKSEHEKSDKEETKTESSEDDKKEEESEDKELTFADILADQNADSGTVTPDSYASIAQVFSLNSMC